MNTDKLNKELKDVVTKIWARDLGERGIELINSLISEKHQQIIKNPNYKTFEQWVNYNPEILEDDGEFSWWIDKYETQYEYDKTMWEYIFNGNYYWNSQKVMLAFFKKYHSLIPLFLAKQNLVEK